MLVLLIIFMVTAPLMTSGVSVDLPKTNAKPLNTDSQPLTVSINATGKIFLQDQEVQLAELVAKLQAIAQNNQDRRIFVRGDKDLAYGRIMEVMGTITQGGFTKVALLAEQPARAARQAAASGRARRPAEGRRVLQRVLHGEDRLDSRTDGHQSCACGAARSSPPRSTSLSCSCC